MGKFLEYNPDQAYLLPPSVRDVLGTGHLCFFVRRVIAKLSLGALRNEYGEEGGPAYAPEMLVSVCLYAYALGVTSSRRLEQRIRRDIRRWQKQCDADDPNEGAGNEVDSSVMERLEQQLQGIPERLERLQKSGRKKISRSDPDNRFLRERSGFTLGYTATLAVSEDHLIVAQQIEQASTDNELLVPMVAIVEPVNGVLKEQPGMRRFRQRGLAKVAVEWALATTAYSVTRMWRTN